MALSPAKLEALQNRTVRPGERRKLFWTLYGPPGAGKTVTSAMIGERNLIITDETGYDSLVNHPELDAKTKVIPFQGFSDIMDYCDGIDAGQFDYDHFIIDTFSGMQQVRIHENLSSPDTKGFTRNHPDIPTWDDYNLSLQHCFKVLRRLMECKAHVTIICHARVPNVAAMAKGELTRPDLTEKVFNLCNKYSSMLVYMQKEKDGVTRMLHFAGDNRLAIKSRIIPESKKKLQVDPFVTEIRNWIGYN